MISLEYIRNSNSWLESKPTLCAIMTEMKVDQREQFGDQRGLSLVVVAVFTVAVLALVAGGVVFNWSKIKVAKTAKGKQAPEASPLLPLVTPLATDSPGPTVTPDHYAGWLTYTNDVYHYQFRYPAGATIEEVDQSAFSLSPEEVASGMTFADKFREYTGKICLTINSGLGYVQISAPANEGFAHVICGRTGRAYEGPDRSETLTIDGGGYSATGFEEQGPGETLNYHNETLVVVLSDGTRIEYGSRPDGTATFTDYEAMRDDIIRITESYRKI
jgi:hypothetical protein